MQQTLGLALSREVPLRKRIFRITCLIFTLSLAVMVLTSALIANLGFWVNVITVVSCLFYVTLLWLDAKTEISESFLSWLFIIFTLLLGVFLWFSTDSWRGAVTISSPLGFLIFQCIVPRKEANKVLLTSFAFLGTIGVLEYYFPQLVQPYPDETTYLVDVWITLIITLIAVSVVIQSLSKAYDYEHETLKEKNQKLEEAQQQISTTASKLRQSNQDLREALEELENTQGQLIQSEKLASIGQLAAGLAHELNNPINFIYGSAQALQASANDIAKLLEAYEKVYHQIPRDAKTTITQVKKRINWNELKLEIPDLIEHLKQGSARVIDITNTLQFFTHIESLKPEKTDLHHAIEAAITLLSGSLVNVNVDLQLNANQHIAKVYPWELSQVFINTIQNAVDAMKTCEVKELKITTQNTDQAIAIDIIDSGIGISEDIANKIFDPFFSTKPVGEGKGLGLATSYNIIQKHSGQIKALPNEPKGTIIRIELPLKPISEQDYKSNLSPS